MVALRNRNHPEEPVRFRRNQAREGGKGNMTKNEATKWVLAHEDGDELDEDELEAAFTAIFERDADDEDREEGLWSHLCAAMRV